MVILLKMINMIDWVNAKTARSLSWLLLFMGLANFGIACLRYSLDLGWVWTKDLVIYMHSLLFMLSMAYTLQEDAHVRIDIFYRALSAKKQAMVNFFGFFFLLLPFCLLMIFTSWPYVWNSWSIWEDSPQTGGLPGLFLIKTSLLLMPLLLLLQGFSLATHSFLTLFARAITSPSQKSPQKKPQQG